MKILSSNTNGQWSATLIPLPPGQQDNRPPDFAKQEAHRALSELFRCDNLVVLSGLGTSMCVQPHVQPPGLRPPTMRDLWERVQAKTNEGGAVDHFSPILANVGYAGQPHDIEALLSRCRLAESYQPTAQAAVISAFILMAEKEIAEATNFVWPNHDLPVHAEFLRRAARRSNRKSRMKIFTTNYDRCFEEAGRQGRFVVIDGFSSTQPPTFDAVHFTYDIVRRSQENDTQDFIPNVFHLYKLHGSIDWSRDEVSGEIYRSLSSQKPLLIYPRNSKYELAFEQPYLEMISAFQSALREPNTGLLIIGFGFNDNHLSEPIMSALRSNLSMKIAAVSPRAAPWVNADGQAEVGECGTNKYLHRLKDLAKAGDGRIALLNCGFEHLIHYIPDQTAETDLEQHLARLRIIGNP